MFPDVINPNAIDLSILEAHDSAEKDRQREVLRAREYHAGDQPTYLTDRLKEFLNIGDDDGVFAMNVTRVVVVAVAERLQVAGVDCADEASRAWAAQFWAANYLDAYAGDVHENALSESEYFVIAEWDADLGYPRAIFHPRWVDLDVSEDGGWGCWAVYANDDPMQPMLYAVKRWTETIAGKATQRANVYYPDRVEKYAYRAGWQPVVDAEGDPWPTPWTYSNGDPIGIPVIHFRNRNLRPEAADAWPMQDALNKALIDLLASADLTAFRIYKMFGMYPTTDGAALKEDGSNALSIQPGIIIGNANKTPSEAGFDAIEPADLTQLRELKRDLVLDIAAVTDTPPSRFRITAAIASDQTQKQENEPLAWKVSNRQVIFGAAWSQLLNIARSIANVYGQAGLSEDTPITALWREAFAKSEAEKRDELKFKREAGIPRRQLWAEMGYSPEKVEEMLRDPEVQAMTFATYPGPLTGDGDAV